MLNVESMIGLRISINLKGCFWNFCVLFIVFLLCFVVLTINQFLGLIGIFNPMMLRDFDMVKIMVIPSIASAVSDISFIARIIVRGV